MCPAPVPEGFERGYLIPIGGAENKKEKPSILKRFAKLAGGSDAKIVIIPTASRLDETGPVYQELFLELGAGIASYIPITSREDCDNPEFAAEIEQATGVFITGGNQMRLSTILGGTVMAQAIRTANAEGVHIAGTSAGASIMSNHMMGGGDSNSSPTEDGAKFAPGLGLTNWAVIDQHFTQRNRLGRLLSAVAYNPFLIGMGVDEDTAAFIDQDGVLEVVGSGTVTIIDGADLKYSSAAQARSGDPLTLLGLKMHVMGEGSKFDMTSRVAFAPHIDGQGSCNIGVGD